MPLRNLRSISHNQLGSLFELVNNINMKGYYKDNFVDFNDLADKNQGEYKKTLVGIIYKMEVNQNGIFLKILDYKNMIDTHKVYVNFKHKDQINKFGKIFKINQIIEFGENLRQTISKKLEILFAVNVEKNTEIKKLELKDNFYKFSKQKLSERIENNIK